jgi:hypothetical protein
MGDVKTCGECGGTGEVSRGALLTKCPTCELSQLRARVREAEAQNNAEVEAAGRAAGEIAALRARVKELEGLAEGRLKALEEKAADAKREWTRAENAERARDVAEHRATTRAAERDAESAHLRATESALKAMTEERDRLANERPLQNMLKRAQEAEARAEETSVEELKQALEAKYAAYRGIYALWLRVARAMTPTGGPDITDEEVVVRVESAEARARDLETILREYDQKLAEVWGKEDAPHAVARGWVETSWRAALATPAPAEATGGPRFDAERALLNERKRLQAEIQRKDEALREARIAIDHGRNRPHEHNPDPSWIPSTCDVFARGIAAIDAALSPSTKAATPVTRAEPDDDPRDLCPKCNEYRLYTRERDGSRACADPDCAWSSATPPSPAEPGTRTESAKYELWEALRHTNDSRVRDHVKRALAHLGEEFASKPAPSEPRPLTPCEHGHWDENCDDPECTAHETKPRPEVTPEPKCCIDDCGARATLRCVEAREFYCERHSRGSCDKPLEPAAPSPSSEKAGGES